MIDAAWHAARAKVIGGSEVSALYGAQPDYAMSHYTLWHVKAGKIPPPEVNTERAKWGILLEEAIAAAVMETKGWHLHRPPARHTLHPRVAGMGCTMDFLIEGERPGVAECKNADWLIHKRSWDKEPPLHIQLQLQHQLACTGREWGVVACLVGGNHLEVYEFEARPKVIADMEARVAAFWQSIADGKEPPVDGTDSTAGALKAMFGHPADDEIDLTGDNELPNLCAHMLNVGVKRRELEKDEKAAKNAIMAKLGNHARARADGFYINAPLIERAGYEVKPSSYRTLNVKEKINA